MENEGCYSYSMSLSNRRDVFIYISDYFELKYTYLSRYFKPLDHI